MWITKVKCCDVKERGNTDGLNEWSGNWTMVVFVEGENHEQVGYKKFISGRMRNGTVMLYEEKRKRK